MTFINTIGFVEGLPEGEHEYCFLRQDSATDQLFVLCTCGWEQIFGTQAPLALGKDRFRKEFENFIIGHLKEELAKLNPSISEFKEWGWFHDNEAVHE